MQKTVHRVVNLVDPGSQDLAGMDLSAAEDLLRTAPRKLEDLPGSFALVARDGERVLMARSLDRPLRYFLAKESEGPMLIVAEKIDDIRDCLAEHGYDHQFHPSYTRMVPAHHVTTLRLIGCPDPNPTHERFFDPPRATGSDDLDEIGRRYVSTLHREVLGWLERQDAESPIGVLFSGGIDSGAVLVSLERGLRRLGQSPARLKAFTLSVDGAGDDLAQAREFLTRLDLEMLHEVVDVPAEALDAGEAVRVIEDYKPLDVECATMALALLREIRERYPDWRLIVDGDGGDENLKDYPIEENPELSIRSVVSNSMLYQEGWGVDAVKHSLTYSGGYSRSCVRTFAPLRRFGFAGFSPFTRPAVVREAEAIPFDSLTHGSTEALYALKGEVIRRGMKQLHGIDFPVFEKRRFQHGAAGAGIFAERFGVDADAYRRRFIEIFSGPSGLA